MTSRTIQIQTGSRLHFGLILGDESSGWIFGGVGLMLERPGWHVQLQAQTSSTAASVQSDDVVLGTDEAALRVRKLLGRLRAAMPDLPCLHVQLSAEVPFHTGLGAGTQLDLGIAAACRWMCRQQTHQSPLELAVAAGRAERSAIGTWGFDHGGFLVDYGAGVGGAERVRRLALPDDWRIVLVRPRATQGLSGAAESAWFGTRPRMTATLVQQLADIISRQLQPAIEHGRFQEFAAALQQYGDAAGQFYAGQQGHVFADQRIRQLVAALRQRGVTGAAQSSWGPGIGIPAESSAHASRIETQIAQLDRDGELLVSTSAPLNCGATISQPAAEYRCDTRIV